MIKTVAQADDSQVVPSHGGPTPDEIRCQLRLVLSSPVFHGSRRCQQFLEYVCDRQLSGESGGLKERSIAIEVFGRSPQGEDTIVRVGAREVRKRLAQFYMTPEGSSSLVLIELPSGSYVPEFRYVSPQSLASVMPVLEPSVIAGSDRVEAVSPNTRRINRAWVLAAALVGVVAIISAAYLGSVGDARERAFQAFWAPVMRSTEPLLIGVGHPIVYQPSLRASSLDAERAATRGGPKAPYPQQLPLSLPPEDLDGSDMVPISNQYVGFGDMVAANEVSQMLARRSRRVRLRLANSIPFADLRHSQTYLIGSLSNHWTMELGQTWRFQFRWTKDHVAAFVDTQAGSYREWTVPASDDGSIAEDYSLIARVPNSPTGGLVIVSAGIKQFGTEAAGRLLAEPTDLGAILNKLPKGWEDRNLQIILHMRVIGNTPAQPEVVASHVW